VIVVTMIVFNNLLPIWVTGASMFRFLSTGKRLEHPIIIIFTAIFLIT
jgi:hypothetical protein